MNTIFREVLSMSLSAGFLVAVIIGLRWCFRRSPKWVHCILWALVAVRLLVPSLPQSQISMVPERVSDSRAIIEYVEQMPQLTVLPSPAPQEQASPVAEKALVSTPAEVPLALPEAEAPATRPVDWMKILTWVWLAGVSAMGIYALASFLRIRKRVAASVDIGGRVSLCDYIDTPFLLGLFRPRIYLPSELAPETAGYVLAHERAHLARHDHWWKPLGFVLLSIHWFNPMIWAGYILLCRDIEMACDEAVVQTLGAGEKKGYSSALLHCSVPRRMISICPLAFGEVSVKERVKSVLHYRKPALWLTLGGLAAVVLGACLFLTNPVKPFDGELEFYPTAEYWGLGDRLTLYEYDREFREKTRTVYEGGVELYVSSFDYRQEGNTLITSVTSTGSPGCTGLEWDGNAYMYAGVTIQEEIREEMDEQGNVLLRTQNVDGELYLTQHCTYDEKGNLLTDVKEFQNRTTANTYTYDEDGNRLSLVSETNRTDLGYSDTFTQQWEYDGNGNVTAFQAFTDGKPWFSGESTYDENGRVLTHTAFAENSPTRYSTYSWDEAGETVTSNTTYEDGSWCGSGTEVYDSHGNLLSTADHTGQIGNAANFICNDGTESIGIPAEIYTPGEAITAHPYEENRLSAPDPISLELKDVTPTGATLYWHIKPWADTSGFTVGNRFQIHKKVTDHGWTPLEGISIGTLGGNPQSPGELPMADGEYYLEYPLSWASEFGILAPGTYRYTTALNAYNWSEYVEFTVPAAGDEHTESQIQACMDALNALVRGDAYQVTLRNEDGGWDLLTKSGYNYQHLNYATPTANVPSSGAMFYKGVRYSRVLNNWAFSSQTGSESLSQWYTRYVYGHDRLELVKSDKGEITFKADDGSTLTFRFSEDGSLTGIEDGGTVLSVLTTDQEETESVLEAEDLEVCAAFGWTAGSIQGESARTEGFQCTVPSPTDTLLKVYRLAEREFPTGYDTAQVLRDERSDMYQVLFRKDGANFGSVYLDGNGITRLVVMDLPGDPSDQDVRAAINQCKQVASRIQGTDGYAVHTFFDFCGNALNEWTNSTVWVHGLDWMEIGKMQDGDGYGVYGAMWNSGTYFDNEGRGWDENDNPQWWENPNPPEDYWSFPRSWLAGCCWENYVVTLVSDDRSDDSRTIRLSFISKDREQDEKDYDATFYFDGKGIFEKVEVTLIQGNAIVQKQTADIVSLGWDEIGAVMNEQYRLATENK